MGVESGSLHAATLVAGRPGVLHGTMSYLLQDEHGQVMETHSISAGLDYPGVGPEHSHLKDTKRAELRGRHRLPRPWRGSTCCPAPRASSPRWNRPTPSTTSASLPRRCPRTAIILMCLSGRGDKDVDTVARLGE